MTPIEPRFRGHFPAADEPNNRLVPILAIPDWDAQAVESPAANPTLISSSIEAAAAASPAEATDAADWDQAAQEQLPSETAPAAGRLRKTFHVYWSTAKLGRRLKLSTRLPETVRGVLPGIGIAISLLFLWMLFQGNEHDSGQDKLSGVLSSAVKPIDTKPLRAANSASLAEQNPQQNPELNSPIEENANSEGNQNQDPLFTQIPNIASEDSINFPTTAPAGSSPNDFMSSKPEPEQAGNQANITVARDFNSTPRVPAIASVNQTTTIAPSTDRGGSNLSNTSVGLVNKLTAPATQPSPPKRDFAPPSGESSNDSVATRRQSPTGQVRQPTSPQPTVSAPYSYETTDPATFKDPIYNVPPIARRQTRTDDSQSYPANPQANNRETTGRSRR